MIRFLKKLPSISEKTILILLSSVVILHLVVMYLYVQDNRRAWGAADRDAMIQKIINTIQLLKATPKENRLSAIAALDDPNLTVSLTEKPVFDLQFNQISFWEINRQLRIRQAGDFSLSIQLPDQNWLNAKATLNSHIHLSQLLLITLELIMAIAILISAWSIHTFRRPLTKFKQVADNLGVDLDTKIPLIEYGPSLVKETAHAMQKMQLRIQDLIKDRTKMLAAISHDLRTPITRLKLRMQINTPDADAKNMKDLTEMENMITQILSFASQDANKEKKIKLDIFSLIATLCNEMADMHYNVIFKSNSQRIPFYGRPLALKRAFTNLINNGIKYANQVTVDIRTEQSNIIILIEDDGPGIPEKDLNQVFRPFYRGEGSRSRNTGGSGLGLATALDIIRAHNGHIKLNNKKSIGLKVIVTLPIF